MGLGRSAPIASALIDAGWSRGTPVAVIVDAWRAEQQTWRGTLDQMAAELTGIDPGGAGTIVIGDVVATGIQVAATAIGVGWPFQGRQGNQYVHRR